MIASSSGNSTVAVTTILDSILARKQAEVAAAKERVPERVLAARIADAPLVRDFAAALRAATGVALIAEIKKSSPSAGILREDFDPVEIAKTYESHGAACISVLTDQSFFQGKLSDLTDVRCAVGVPVLRKDFLIDRYQVLEARAAGADCVLLIAECLDDVRLRELHSFAADLGMESLIELYAPENLDRVLQFGPRLVGVNNRNLRTFVTDLDHSLSLLDRIPDGMLFVSESGIRTRADVERLQTAGVDAILVGESLMRSPDVGRAVDELLGRT